MIEVRLGEREGFSYVARIVLPQGIIPPFHMIGLPAAFAHPLMGLGWKDAAIRLSEVTEAAAPFVCGGNPLPQAPTRPGAVIAQSKGHNLPRPATQGRPQPALLFPRPDKAPHLIDLQLIARSRGQQRGLEGGSLRRFFLTTPLGFAAPPQRPAQSRAYWAARSRPPESALAAPRYTARWDVTPRSARTPYSDTVACPWDYARSSQSPDSDSGDTDE